jgi:hypothetical protein
MCSLCGVLLSDHWAESDRGVRARLVRVRLLNRILAHFGLSLGEWAGRVFVLRDRTGRTALVADLGSLWLEAERLLGRPLDPLDPELLAALG